MGYGKNEKTKALKMEKTANKGKARRKVKTPLVRDKDKDKM